MEFKNSLIINTFMVLIKFLQLLESNVSLIYRL